MVFCDKDIDQRLPVPSEVVESEDVARDYPDGISSFGRYACLVYELRYQSFGKNVQEIE